MTYLKYISISFILTILFVVYQNYELDELPTGILLHSLGVNESVNLWRDDKLLDLKSFKYLINNKQICDNDQTIVQIVTSYAANVETRSALRRAYPEEHLRKLGVVRVFLLGKLKPFETDVSQMAIQNENERFGDLLQGDFYESYRNLTYKHVMGLKWAVMHCPSKNHIIKMDDDTLVNMYELVKLIDKRFTDSTDLMGYLFKDMRPIRMRANKWYVTKEEYSGNVYPHFLSGWMYVVAPHAAARLVDMAHLVPYFWIDDLFITGVVAEMIHASFIDIGEYFTTHPELIECCISHNVKCDYIVAPSGGDNSLQIKFQRHSEKCQNDCKQLPSKTIDHTCVAKRKSYPLKKGIPSYRVLKV